MFDIAWSEFLVVAVVALVVVGPRDLPALLRTVGKTVATLRRMAGEFQGQFNEAMREAELDGLKDEITGIKNSASKMVGASPFQIARDEIKNALQSKPKDAPSALAGDAPKTDDEADAPSALAPVIAPTPEPPAPGDADFAPVAARQQARKAAARTSGSTKSNAAPKAAARKPAVAKPRAAKTVAAKTVAAKPAAKPAAPAKPKPAAKTAAKPAPKATNGAPHPAAGEKAEAKPKPAAKPKPKSPGAAA